MTEEKEKTDEAVNKESIDTQKMPELKLDEESAADTLKKISNELRKLREQGDIVLVESFESLPKCDDIIYTWYYTTNVNGKATTHEMRFKAIPLEELESIEKAIPLPVPEKREKRDFKGNPVLDELNNPQFIEDVNDPRYIEQKEDALRYRTIAIAEISLGFTVPGNTNEEKFKWMRKQQPSFWQSIKNIVWGRLVGGGLVNFT